MEIRFTRWAKKQLSKLPNQIRKRIDQKIRAYAEKPSALANNVETLKGTGGSSYRLRVGDYRILFKVDDGGQDVIYIYHIAHRKDVYDG